MNMLPISHYENLLPKLVAILELTQKAEGISTPQAKQRLLQATNDFKNAIAQAKDLATNLPGGELLGQQQDEVINMLQALRDSKRTQLTEFATRIVASIPAGQDVKMEVDSTASTPFNTD